MEAPTGWPRLGLALVCVAGGVAAGLAVSMLGLIVSPAASGYGAVVLAFLFGLAGFLVAMPVLAILMRFGPVFAVAATVLVPVGLVGYVDDEIWAPSLGLVCTVLLAAIAWLTDPARGRSDRPSWRGLSGARVGALLVALAVLVAVVPPVASDLKGWRDTTALLEELVDPPLLPTVPGMGTRKLRSVAIGAQYLVTDADGLDFVGVTMYPVDSRPVVADDCFSKTLQGVPPVTGCVEIAPGVYRGEYPDSPGRTAYFLPREHSVTAVRSHPTGLNESKYGLDGPGDAVLRQIATSLRPVPVQSLARQDCRLCRLLPD